MYRLIDVETGEVKNGVRVEAEAHADGLSGVGSQVFCDLLPT